MCLLFWGGSIHLELLSYYKKCFWDFLYWINSCMVYICTYPLSISEFQYKKNPPQSSFNKFEEFCTIKILSLRFFFPIIFCIVKMLHSLNILYNRHLVHTPCSAWVAQYSVFIFSKEKYPEVKWHEVTQKVAVSKLEFIIFNSNTQGIQVIVLKIILSQ